MGCMVCGRQDKSWSWLSNNCCSNSCRLNWIAKYKKFKGYKITRPSKSLANYDYDNWLQKNKKQREARERTRLRKNANKGYEGWHFGLGDQPVYTKNKQEYKQALEARGLMMRDDVKKELR